MIGVTIDDTIVTMTRGREIVAMEPWLSSAADDGNVAHISGSSHAFDDDFKPFSRMSDSGSYISTLETKLERLRGNNKQLTGRTMVEDAERRKNDHMTNLLRSFDGSWSSWNDEYSATEPSNEIHLQTMLRLKFHPEKCALSMEELQSLLKVDHLSLINQSLLDSSDQT